MKISEDALWLDKTGAPQLLSLVRLHAPSSPTIADCLIVQGCQLLIMAGKDQSRKRRDELFTYILEMRAYRSAGSLGYTLGP